MDWYNPGTRSEEDISEYERLRASGMIVEEQAIICVGAISG